MIVSKFGYKGGPSATKEPILKKINDNLIGLELEFNNTLIQDCDNCECCDCDYCDEEGYTYTNPDVYDWVVPLSVNKLDILSTKWTFCHPSLAKKSISDALAPALQYP